MTNADSLASLAMLKVNADVQGRDYIDYIVPFVSYVLDSAPISPEHVQQLLKQEFGIRIPSSVIELVFRRLSRRGYLHREHGIYHAAAPIPKPEIESKRVDARRRMNSVINQLAEYAVAHYSTPWSSETATNAIITYLSQFSIDFLRTYSRGSALPPVAPAQGNDLFIVNAFISRAIDSSPETFDSILILVKGHMLTNALFCPDLSRIQQKFREVTFYLDTPLILHLLGTEGEPKLNAAKELLELVRNLEGSVAVFSHTVEEVNHVLKGCEDALARGVTRGRIIQEARRAGKTPSDFALLRARLDDFYRSHELKRRPTPNYDATFQIDEKVLESAIDEYVDYANPRALIYDVNSVRSVYTLRRGRAPTSIEDSIAVLVTSNSALARAAFDYGKGHESTREVSAVITEFSLANLAWLKAPLGSPDLPRVEVIATCYAAMEPGAALWTKYLVEVDKLKEIGSISPRDHELLRYSLRAREELMNLTLGSQEAFSGKTVVEILERVESEMVKEQAGLLAAEREHHAKTSSQLTAATEQQNLLAKRIHWLAERVAKWVGRAVFVVFAFIVILFAGLSALRLEPIVGHSRWNTFGVMLLAMGGIFEIVLRVVHAAWGFSARGIASAVQTWVAPNAASLISKRLLKTEQPADSV